VLAARCRRQDVPSNLWPLPAGENRFSGAIINSATVTVQGTKKMPVGDALAERNKKGKGESLWMMVESTRQR
jgi:hypothetical protein